MSLDYKEFGETENNDVYETLELPLENISIDNNIDLFVLGTIGGIEIPLLLDTGSKSTIIDEYVFEQIHPNKYRTVPFYPEERAQGVNGEIIPIIAKIVTYLKVSTSDQSLGDDVLIHVVKNAIVPGLLGLPHIFKFIENIDLRNLEITLNEDNWITIPVRILRSITIPAGGIVYIEIEADLSDIPISMELHFRPLLLDVERKPSLLIIPTFYFIKEDVTNDTLISAILIHNPSTVSYNIQKGKIIGTLTGLTESLILEKKQQIYEDNDLTFDISIQPVPTIEKRLPPNFIAYTDYQLNKNYFGEFVNYANADIMNYRDVDAKSNISMIDINPKLESYQLAQIDSIITKYDIIFNSDQQFPPPADAPAMRIDTGNHEPIKQANYRINKRLWEHVPAKIDNYLKKGIIRHSQSAWCNPVNPVTKSNPNDPVRICLDFRKLNAITKKDAFPLPNIQDILEALKNPKYFALIDCVAGYHQIPIHEEDKCKTAFVANGMLLEWNFLIEGLTNAPAWFQRYMVLYVLKGLIEKSCWVYLDDIIVFGKFWEEFIDNLEKVFERLKQYNVSVKASKTRIGYEEIKILGHIVGNGQMKPNPELVKSITEFTNPQTVKQLQRFLGLANYYRKFIDKFAYIAQPLYELLKKEYLRIPNLTSVWTERQEASMKLLKTLLSSAPILKCPDSERMFILTTDACQQGIAAVLTQPYDDGEHPVAYISRTLDKYERKYNASELECLAIVWAVEQFRMYFGSSKFLIYTDHKPLAWLKTSASKNARLHRWATSLSQYNFEIKHKPGKELVHVDCLSRALEALDLNDTKELSERKAEIKALQQTIEAKKDDKHTISRIGYNTKSLITSNNNNNTEYYGCTCTVTTDYTNRLFCQYCGKIMDHLILSMKHRNPNQIVIKEYPIIMITPYELFNTKNYNLPLFQKYKNTDSNQFETLLSESAYTIKDLKVMKLLQIDKKNIETKPNESNLIAYNGTNRKKKRVHFDSIRENTEEIKELTDNKQQTQSESETEPLYEIEKIIDKQISPVTKQVKYLVKWKGFGEKQSTWESEKNLKEDAPEAILQYETEKEQEILTNIREQQKQYQQLQQQKPTRLNQDYLLTGELNSLIEEIVKEQWKDPELLPILKYLKDKVVPASDFEAQKIIKFKALEYLLDPETNALYKIKRETVNTPQQTELNKRLVIPKIYQMDIIHHQHDSPFSGHLGVNKTYERIKRYFYWNQCLKDVDNYIRTCPRCQTMKSKQNRNIPIHTMPIPSFPFEIIAVDFKGPINTTDNNKYILVFIDYFTRWAITIPTKDATSETIANAFIEHVITKYGAPKKLLSDRGTNFLSELMKEVYKWFSVKKLNTTAYHPEANGLVERFNQTIMNILNTLCDYETEHWSDYLAPATWAYNTSMQEALKESPYVVLYGRQPLLIGPGMDSIELDKYETQQSYIQSMLEHFDYVNKVVKPEMEKAQLKYLRENSKLTAIPEYKIGDKVWYFLTVPTRVKSIENMKLPEKLRSKVNGPYTVIRKLSLVTYEIAWITDRKTISYTAIVHAINLLPVYKRENQTEEEFQKLLQNIADFRDIAIKESNPAINEALLEQQETHEQIEQQQLNNNETLITENKSNTNEIKPSTITNDSDIEMKTEPHITNIAEKKNTITESEIKNINNPQNIVTEQPNQLLPANIDNNHISQKEQITTSTTTDSTFNIPQIPLEASTTPIVTNKKNKNSKLPKASIKTPTMKTRSQTKWINTTQLSNKHQLNSSINSHPQYILFASGKIIYNPITHKFYEYKTL